MIKRINEYTILSNLRKNVCVFYLFLCLNSDSSIIHNLKMSSMCIQSYFSDFDFDFTQVQSDQYEVLISSIISSFKATKDFQKAHELYEQKILVSEYLSSSVIIYNSLIECFIDCGKNNKVFELFMKLNPINNTKLINLNSFFSKDSSSNGKANIITYILLLKVLCKTSKTFEAMEIFNYLKQNQEHYSLIQTSLYCSLLDALARNKEEENCLKVFNHMKATKIELNINVFGIMMKLYSGLNNKEKLIYYFDQIKLESSIKPNIVIYQIIIKYYISQQDFYLARDYFRQMISNDIKPDNIMYELMIKTSLEYNLIEEAIEYFSEALVSKIPLANFCFDNIFKSINKNERMEINLKQNLIVQLLIIAQMNSYKINPNIQSMVNKSINDITVSKNLDIEKRKKEKELIQFGNISKDDLEIRIDVRRLNFYINEVNKDNTTVNAPAPYSLKSINDISTNKESYIQSNGIRLNKNKNLHHNNAKYGLNKVSLYDM